MENFNFIKELGTSDFESLMIVQQAYREECFGEDIMETGFNTTSGYVYIALENGVTIASCFGRSVDFITNDFETGEEEFFETYEEAYNNINN